MENSLTRSAASGTPSRLRTMTHDGTPRKAPLSAKKTKLQVCYCDPSSLLQLAADGVPDTSVCSDGSIYTSQKCNGP